MPWNSRKAAWLARHDISVEHTDSRAHSSTSIMGPQNGSSVMSSSTGFAPVTISASSPARRTSSKRS